MKSYWNKYSLELQLTAASKRYSNSQTSKLSVISCTKNCLIFFSNSNHMFGRAICLPILDKLREFIFELLEWNEGDLSQKLPEPNMWLLVNHTKPTNPLYWNLLTRAITNQRDGNYKITLLTVQCWLQSNLWLLLKCNIASTKD